MSKSIGGQTKKHNRGFRLMSKEKRLRIARKGGKTSVKRAKRDKLGQFASFASRCR